ncbi:hypothetical protein LTR37_015360 [Vermiconidia calcicola]|uniref:Uncharacterized protein n=1 Tax=Vermiconidia calcicola TaxID=1690605 RepID=A0ACC3MR53_9PEZI|nr:hypothetical protein LTR37_015360 [Vermiconidia calcicola]
MEDLNHLHGSCACERNQYTIIIPTSSTSLAQVFFDNSVANRRSQATPVTAWLRVPLDFYHSTTYAHFPDETHHSIRRTFHTPAAHPAGLPTRRQFCGYCGTHLTAWNEGHEAHSADHLDITLGSLTGESVRRLQELAILADADEEDGDEGDEDDEDSMGGVIASSGRTSASAAHRMHNRGMPYFEEMVENSRLGRIKRQKGGHSSRDGRMTVHWEVVEIGGDEPTSIETSSGGESNKRQRVDE